MGAKLSAAKEIVEKQRSKDQRRQRALAKRLGKLLDEIEEGIDLEEAAATRGDGFVDVEWRGSSRKLRIQASPDGHLEMHRSGFDPKCLRDAKEAMIEIYSALAPVEIDQT
jgi:hypothetical protein